MNGHIRQTQSRQLRRIRWQQDGRTRTKTICGKLAQARAELRAALVAVDRGEHIEPTRLTVAQLVDERIAAWHASGRISGRTREAYETAAQRLAPIAGIPVQRLGSARRSQRLHLGWRHLSSWSKRASHGVLQRALGDALRHRVCTRNAAADQGPPRGGKRPEVVMLDAEQVAALIARLDDEWRAPVIVALYCGLRRSEQLALNWNRIDLDGGRMEIVEALDKAGGKVSVKQPKSKAGRRVISLPQIVVATLRDHRRRQLERALLLGAGRQPDSALVFPGMNGGHDSPRAFTNRWARAAVRFGLRGATWHSLIHSHASMLVSAGLPVTTVAARLGHATAGVTLSVYARLFATDDAAAAAAIDRALGKL